MDGFGRSRLQPSPPLNPRRGRGRPSSGAEISALHADHDHGPGCSCYGSPGTAGTWAARSSKPPSAVDHHEQHRAGTPAGPGRWRQGEPGAPCRASTREARRSCDAGSHRGLTPWALIFHTGPVTERPRVREIDDDAGQRLVRIIRRGGGSVVTLVAAVAAGNGSTCRVARTVTVASSPADQGPSTEIVLSNMFAT